MTTDEMVERVVEAAIENLRQTSFVPFWEASIGVTPDEAVNELIDESRMEEKNVRRLLESAVSQRSYESFSLEVRDGTRDHYGRIGRLAVRAAVKEGCEWDQVLRESWTGAESPNDWFLSDNAVRMLKWLRGPKNKGDFVHEQRLGLQAGLRGAGCQSNIETYLKEIALKSPHGVSVEIAGGYGRGIKARLVTKESEKERGKFKNPIFAGKIVDADRTSRDDYVRMLEDRVLDAGLEEGHACLLFSIHSRTELHRCLPDFKDHEDASPNDMMKLLEKVRLARGLRIAARMKELATEGWCLGAVLEDGWTWAAARESVREHRERTNPGATYGLSESASKILDWVWNLHDDEMALGMTPCVEPVSDEQIGIEGLMWDRNSRAKLELLVEEINEKTPFRFRLIPWKGYSEKHHRILVRKKRNREEDLVRQIQLLGLEKGACVTADAVEEALAGLWKVEPVSR